MTLLDAYALVAFLVGGPAAPRVRAILREGDATVATTNLAEALDVSQRVFGLPIARAMDILDSLFDGSLRSVQLDLSTARRAAEVPVRSTTTAPRARSPSPMRSSWASATTADNVPPRPTRTSSRSPSQKASPRWNCLVSSTGLGDRRRRSAPRGTGVQTRMMCNPGIGSKSSSWVTMDSPRDGGRGDPGVVDGHPLAHVPQGHPKSCPRLRDAVIDRQRIECQRLGQCRQPPVARLDVTRSKHARPQFRDGDHGYQQPIRHGL